jgi:hypothetical protein
MKILTTVTGHKIILDDEDYEWAVQFTWWIDHGYAVRWNSEQQRHTRLHRELLDASPGTEVDHQNHNRLDNQRANLRLVTGTQNRKNRKGSRIGLKGAYRRPNGTWQAMIQTEKKRRWLGNFRTEREAGIAYDLAAVKYFREFASTKFQFINEYVQ